MTAIVTTDLRYAKIKSFIAALSTVPLYVGIGKSLSWSNIDGVGSNDSNPPTPSISDNGSDFRDLLSLKRVFSYNTSIVIPRVNWNSWNGVQTPTKYSYWNEPGATEPNYVITSDYDVFKCIKRVGTGNSTTMPSKYSSPNVINYGPISTGDGYTWKYMFTLTAQDAVSNLTDDWIPVRNVQQQSDEAVGSNQWNVQQNTTPGTVNSIEIIDGGAGYSSQTNFPVTGDGSGALVDVTVNGSGTVTAINVVSAGTGYSWAQLNLPTGTNLDIQVILSPILGHGSDVISELGGKYLLIRSSLNFNEGSGDLITKNEYRKINLILQPLEFLGTQALQGTYDYTYKLVLNDTSDINEDDLLTHDNGSVCYVVENNKTENKLKVTNISGGTFTVGTTNITVNSNPIKKSLVSIVNPEIKPASGSIIYKDYRRPISRNETQREQIDIVLEF